MISFAKTSGLSSSLLYGVCDFILWYAKDIKYVKYHQLYAMKMAGETGASKYERIELPSGQRRTLTKEEKEGIMSMPQGARFLTDGDLTSQGNPLIEFEYDGKKYSGTYKTNIGGLEKLAQANRIHVAKGTLRFIRYLDDFPVYSLNSAWMDIGGIQSRSDPKIYVVQTATNAVERCLIMTTDPGDLVLDPTCGSGTSAYVAEQWGRRWITCDTSRIAITLAKQRLMTSLFDYYELAHPEEGIGSGFRYKTVPHVTLKSIANNPDMKEVMSRKEIEAAIKKYTEQETLYDQPFVDNTKARVAGPFTVEAVPAPSGQADNGD